MRSAILLMLMAGCAPEGVARLDVLDDGGAARRGLGERGDAYTSDVIPGERDVLAPPESGGVDALQDAGRDVVSAGLDSRDSTVGADALEVDAEPAHSDAGADSPTDLSADHGQDLGGCDDARPILSMGECVQCKTDLDCRSAQVCVLGDCVSVAGPDSPPEIGADARAPDALPRDLTSSDEQAGDAQKPCSGCADPAWACSTCFDEAMGSTNPKAVVLVQCVHGKLYDCRGLLLPLGKGDEACLAGDGTSCVPCTGTATVKNTPLQCPYPVPYCNAATGECTGAP